VRRALVVVLALAGTGCESFYRWPDRASRPPAKRVVEAPLPADAYRVVAGDTVYSIAFRNQLDFRDVAMWNDIGTDYLIKPGQVLRLTAPPVSHAHVSPPAGSRLPARTAPVVASVPRVEAPLPAPHQWQWPTKGPVAKTFGDGSKGIDISGDFGQPVKAAAGGKVVYSGSALKGYGELIIIKHDDQHLSAYGYNRKRLVEEGAQVAAGQQIAELGMGPEQKAMLHFEVRRRGKPVDPMEFLK
jgi:lipoprotein NlpD